MRVLVIGGTGTVGSQVVRDLLARNVEVQVLTRDSKKASALPKGVEGVVGDLMDPATVRKVFQKLDGVFMLNALGAGEGHEAMMGINGARLAGVPRFVYMTVHQLDEAAYLPHFAAKVAPEMALKASGIAWTILRPNNFFQNEEWFKAGILEHGVYSQPIGDRGISRVDVRDIAEAAAITLTADGHAGKTYSLVGPETYSGQRVAEIWSEALGREIRYGGNDLDAWEKVFLNYMPAWLVFDFRLMYEYFQGGGFQATREEVERQTKLLGHPPRRLEDYAREKAREWKS